MIWAKEISFIKGVAALAAYDTVAPHDKMLKPLANKLLEIIGNVTYQSIKSNHSFVGQRMRLTRFVGEWIEELTK